MGHSTQIGGSQATLPGTKIKSEWIKVTPELASNYLENNLENRTPSDRHITRLADDMKGDRFFVTHQGLAFTDEGVLVDGQHRCMAIVRSGKPQWMLVTTGINDREPLDIGKIRTPYDFKRCPQRAAHSSAVKVLLGISDTGTTVTAATLSENYAMVTKPRQLEHWMHWPQVEDWEILAAKAAKNVPACGTSALLAAAVVYPEHGEEFLTGLKEMTNLQPGDPRAALLKYNRSFKSNLRGGTCNSTVVALKALGAFARGESMQILKLSGNLERVKIPSAFML
jgi:hypothetical protein